MVTVPIELRDSQTSGGGLLWDDEGGGVGHRPPPPHALTEEFLPGLRARSNVESSLKTLPALRALRCAPPRQ